MTSIEPYRAAHVGAVRAFNRRIAAVNGLAEFQFPESHIPELAPGDGRRIYQEHFLATEGADVRGAYMLRHQDFSFSGAVRAVAHYRLPVSEGVANKVYAGVALQMVRDALARQPLLFAIGMGGLEKPLPRMLKALGWSTTVAPFYFQVVHARAFLRNVQAVRSTPVRRVAADLAAISGAGWAGLRLLRAFRAAPEVPYEIVPRFDAWADELWQASAPRYKLSAVRDSSSLNLLYPGSDARFVRIRTRAGWALLYDARMQAHRHFGSLRLGVIADTMALPERADEVIAAATCALRDRGVDLIVSNQSHAAWRRALKRAGYLSGPSNYAFAASKQLSALFDGDFDSAHINRGDGDGLVNI